MSAITYDELEVHLHSGLWWMHSYLLRLRLAKAYVLLYILLPIVLFVVRRDTHVIERGDLGGLTEEQVSSLRERCREYIGLLDQVIGSAGKIRPWISLFLQQIFTRLSIYRDRIEDRLEAMELSKLSTFGELLKEVEARVHERPPVDIKKDWRAMIDQM
jgi:hypothetical protein